MKAKIIAMASAKGGAGKTVLTATFGAFLSRLNKKVLIVDADAATNGLTLMYFREVRIQNDIAFSKNGRPGGTFQLGYHDYTTELVKLNDTLDLLPATYPYLNTEEIDEKDYATNLFLFLESNRNRYDYIFLDAQAGSDHFAKVAISRGISDEVIIVSEYDPLSAAGIERLKGFFREDLTYERTWILLNKLLPDFVQSFSDFLEVSKYLSPIPWDAEIVKAYARRRLALDMENGNEFTLGIAQTLKSLLNDSIEKDIQSWMNEKAESIKAPVITQYEETEKELYRLIELKYIFDKSEARKGSINTFAVLVFTVVMLLVYYFGSFYLHQPISFSEFNARKLSASEVLILAGCIATGYIFYFVGRKIINGKQSSSSAIVEKSRIRRKIEVLEDKLKKLEVLKNADLPTLIKEKV